MGQSTPIFTAANEDRIPVGISACVLGQEVRYNRGHKRSRFCTDILGRYFDYHPVCPEVEIGLGVPREPIRLVSNSEGEIRAQGTVHRDRDVTEALIRHGRDKARELDFLSGYIFQQGSPSCGLYRVKLYNQRDGAMPGGTQGLYAGAFLQEQPLLPVEEAGRLNDPQLRENFVTRVFAYHRWRELCAAGLSYQSILDFYVAYKYLLMAHHVPTYREIGKLLANAGDYEVEDLGERFFERFMAGLRHVANRKSITNVLQHMSGYLKRKLPSAEKQELRQVIDQYRAGMVPLIAPLVLLKHHIRHKGDEYIGAQHFLQPYPDDLSLRNEI